MLIRKLPMSLLGRVSLAASFGFWESGKSYPLIFARQRPALVGLPGFNLRAGLCRTLVMGFARWRIPTYRSTMHPRPAPTADLLFSFPQKVLLCTFVVILFTYPFTAYGNRRVYVGLWSWGLLGGVFPRIVRRCIRDPPLPLA